MKASEIRDQSAQELAGRLDESRKELFNLRFQAATGQLKDLQRMREVRKDMARVMTVLRERELATGSAEGE